MKAQQLVKRLLSSVLRPRSAFAGVRSVTQFLRCARWFWGPLYCQIAMLQGDPLLYGFVNKDEVAPNVGRDAQNQRS